MIKHFSFMTARARLAIWNDEKASLSGLISGSPGRGHATGLMREVSKFADDKELTVYLVAQRFHYADDRGLDNIQLMRFYEKFDFTYQFDVANPKAFTMYRRPQNLHVV
jgi:hypothetical protein